MGELPQEPSARTLAAYLSGESSPMESAEVVRWAQSTPEYAARFDQLVKAWHSARGNVGRPGAIGSWNVDQIWGGIARKLDEDQLPPLRLVGRHTPQRVAALGISRRRNVAAWTAAAACVAILAGVWADQRLTRQPSQQPPTPPEAVREYHTERGQRASGTLPDGSAFQLGPLSVMRISGTYGAPERTVELVGDAYFNVTHDSAHPFVVRTASTTIRDVGTRFVVRARSTERRVEVAVADGSVSIEPQLTRSTSTQMSSLNRATGLMIGAGEAAFVDDRGTVKRLARASVAARFAWTHGELAFDNVPVPNVLAELSRWYGNTFMVADGSLDTVRLTTTLRGETLLEALVVLETALDVDARVRAGGDTVMLTHHTKGEGQKP